MALPTDAKDRKEYPITCGVLDYFPDAIAAVANVSFVGNKQHNPGEKLHWSRGKSNDHEDCIARHLLERGGKDSDGVRHTAKLAWRALALLQLEIEAAAVEPAKIPTPSIPGWWFSKIGDPFDWDVSDDPRPIVYVSGPMRGLDAYNFPAFDEARDRARKQGWDVISPADLDRAHGLDPIKDPEGVKKIVDAWTDDDLREIVQRDMDALMSLRKERGDAIIMLPGWEKSTGALAEFMIARWLGLKVLDAKTMEPLEAPQVRWMEMLDAVERCLNGKGYSS